MTHLNLLVQDLAKMWGAIEPKEKAKFEKLAAEAKTKYEVEKAARAAQ